MMDIFRGVGAPDPDSLPRSMMICATLLVGAAHSLMQQGKHAVRVTSLNSVGNTS